MICFARPFICSIPFSKMPSVPGSWLIPAEAGRCKWRISHDQRSAGLAEGYAIVADYFAFHPPIGKNSGFPGIYGREVASALTDGEAGALIGRPGGLIESVLHLSELENYARRIVRPYLVPSRSKRDLIFADLGEGPKRFKIAEPVPDAVRDLLELLSAAYAVRRLASIGDCQALAVMACTLGQIIERIQVRPFEPLVAKAKGQRQRAVDAGKTRVLLTSEQQDDAVRDIKATIDRGTKLQTACKQLSAKYGVSFKTLVRYFKREGQP